MRRNKLVAAVEVLFHGHLGHVRPEPLVQAEICNLCFSHASRNSNQQWGQEEKKCTTLKKKKTQYNGIKDGKPSEHMYERAEGQMFACSQRGGETKSNDDSYSSQWLLTMSSTKSPDRLLT